MSITGAVAELNKEIERLTKIRDSLLQGISAPDATSTAKKPEPQKKFVGLRAVVPAKTSVPAKKRVLSAAQKKKISETLRARWAAVPAKKRVLSAAQKKKISETLRARWAAAKKAGLAK
jgi:hypothetical protein